MVGGNRVPQNQQRPGIPDIIRFVRLQFETVKIGRLFDVSGFFIPVKRGALRDLEFAPEFVALKYFLILAFKRVGISCGILNRRQALKEADCPEKPT